MKTTIVALSGTKGSGKDTACSAMLQIFQPNMAQKIAFAGSMKTAMSSVFDIPLDKLEDPVEKERHVRIPYTLEDHYRMFAAMGVTFGSNTTSKIEKLYHDNGFTEFLSIRQAMQLLGTEILRGFDDQIHVKAAINKIKIGGLNIFTDCRFNNEVQALKNYAKTGANYVHIWIEREGYEADTNSHVSEPKDKLGAHMTIKNCNYDTFCSTAQSIAIAACMGLYQ
jgi:hypothetical protein